MKICWGDVQPCHLFIGDLDPFRVRVDIEIGLDRQTLAGVGVGNQINDHLTSFQGATPPIGRNVAKHAMLDFVPLAGVMLSETYQKCGVYRYA